MSNVRYAKSHPSFKWVQASKGNIPPEAVQGGREADGKPLFIARTFHKGSLVPGKAAPHLGGCYVSYYLKEHFYKDYYVLCGDASQLRWIECRGPVKPVGWVPLEAGYEENGDELFVSKIAIKGSEQIGKAGLHFGDGMIFGMDKKEKYAQKTDLYYTLALLQ